MSWRYREKAQPRDTKFTVPAVDAPNVNGARMFGLVPGAVGEAVGEANTAALRQAVEAGRVPALYVFDPGPEGSIGDTDVDCRRPSQRRAAAAHRPGRAHDETGRAPRISSCPAHPTSRRRRPTRTSRVASRGPRAPLPAPGDAMEDWQILVNLGAALGVAFDYSSAARRARESSPDSRRPEHRPRRSSFAQSSARHWLQASNPSERWKWDFMFQDLPPVKGNVDGPELAAAAARRDCVERSEMKARRATGVLRPRSAFCARDALLKAVLQARQRVAPTVAEVTPVARRASAVRAGTDGPVWRSKSRSPRACTPSRTSRGIRR